MFRILTVLLIIIAVCSAGICLGSEKLRADNYGPKNQDRSEEVKRAIKKGSFRIGRKRIAVILNTTERAGHVLSSDSFEIQDEAGVSYYKQELGLVPESFTNIEGIFELQGKSGDGLIIYFTTSPTAPPAGTSFQIFGVEKETVKPLSPPISVYGSIEQLPKGKSSELLKLFDGDFIKVKVWKELIGVVIPLVVDFKKLTISPLKNKGIFDIYFATPDRPRTSFGDRIKFYDDHDADSKKDTIAPTEVKSVEFLDAYADVNLIKKNGSQMLDIDVSNLWLKVKINGKTGWVNDENDFFTLGLIPI